MLYKPEEKELFEIVSFYSTYKHDIRQGGKNHRKGIVSNKPYGKNYIEKANLEKSMQLKKGPKKRIKNVK